MRKFIILLAVTACLSTVVQAQQPLPRITKMYMRQNTRPDWKNLATDTILFYGVPKVGDLQIFTWFEFTNGDKPMYEGDSIMIQGTFLGALFYILKDQTNALGTTLAKGTSNEIEGYIHYLTADLAAGESIDIKFEGMGQQMTLGMVGSSFLTETEYEMGNGDLDTLYSTLVTGQVPYAVGYGENGFINRNQYENNNVRFIDYMRVKRYKAVVGIKESIMEKVNFYPNPVNSSLTITNLKNTDVEIYNIVGQRIVKQENLSGDVAIDMKEYPDGLYFVKMQNGKAVRTEKIKLVK